MEFDSLENKIGYIFKDKNLLREAFTHPSVSQRFNYERLEFLGDAVLQLAVSEKIFLDFKDKNEGYLTLLRSNIVRGKALVPVALNLGLGEYLILDPGAEKNDGRNKPSTLENITESLFGAVFEDSDYETAKRIIYGLINTDVQPGMDYKSMVQDYLQKAGITDYSYKVISESGPPHNKVFEVSCSIRNREFGTASANSKKAAEQKAAEIAYKKLVGNTGRKKTND